jgi:hypothetical protein
MNPKLRPYLANTEQRHPDASIEVLPQKASADRSSVRIICSSCESDFHPAENRYKLIPEVRRATPMLREYVDLNLQTFVSVTQSQKRTVEEECQAFIGKCGRCGKTYLVHVE